MENIKNIERFSAIILNRVKNGKIDYIDAILTYCEEMEVDVESIYDLISPVLRSNLEEEAKKNNIIKSNPRLTEFI